MRNAGEQNEGGRGLAHLRLSPTSLASKHPRRSLHKNKPMATLVHLAQGRLSLPIVQGLPILDPKLAEPNSMEERSGNPD